MQAQSLSDGPYLFYSEHGLVFNLIDVPLYNTKLTQIIAAFKLLLKWWILTIKIDVCLNEAIIFSPNFHNHNLRKFVIYVKLTG
jgi:hypothetical protein